MGVHLKTESQSLFPVWWQELCQDARARACVCVRVCVCACVYTQT